MVVFTLPPQALSLVTSSSQDGSQTELADLPSGKVKRTEKQEVIFRLQQALSSRMSEAVATKEWDAEKENAGEGSDGSHSPSSCSTVSSSGVVQGEYLVNPEEPSVEEEGNQEPPREREEDEEPEEDSGEEGSLSSGLIFSLLAFHLTIQLIRK